MNMVVIFLRLLLGLPFLVFGLNGFFQFMEPPSGAPPEALAFLKALTDTGYLMELLKGFEVLCGVMLVTGRFVPLALALLAPILVNIAAFHLVLDPKPEAMGFALALVGAELALAVAYRGSFKGMLRNAGPGG